ncbi:MAG: UDP-2,3-diacylglucosamine diphosphatase [Lysobacterales bacterium]|jgi:UDP-2,3-diacylglucosamine hydrolase
MSTLFISDLHLEDGRPECTAWLRGLLEGPARSADALHILGDLFEYWIGDDAPSATAVEVAEGLSDLAHSGVLCYFIHGNRDFLLGESWAASAGIRLLPETVVADLYGTPTLLLHGDTLCTDDTEYQAVRRQMRDPAWQAHVLTLPVPERLRMAREARDASMQHTGTAAEAIMDVNEQAVRDTFAAHGVRRMIHGHTHRPAVHRHRLKDGSEGERIVLADWYHAGSYLRVTPEGAESIEL